MMSCLFPVRYRSLSYMRATLISGIFATVASIAMADAGLGIFRVAWACRQAQQDFLLRLTKSRFDSVTIPTDSDDLIRLQAKIEWCKCWGGSWYCSGGRLLGIVDGDAG